MHVSDSGYLECSTPVWQWDDTFFDIELGTNAFKNITSFLKMRYLSWSSRIIIEGFMVLATKLPHAIWIILNAGIMLLMIFLMLKIIGNKERNFKYMLLLEFMILSVWPGVYISAGTIATMMNYIWPAAFCAAGIVPLYYSVHQKRLHFWQMVLISIGIIYAANMEIAAALLFAYYIIYFLMTARSDDQWTLRKYVIFNFVLICGSLFFILTCPGNRLRTVSETAKWLPEFSEYTLFDKLIIGWQSFASYYMTAENFNYALPLFSLVLGIFNYRKSGKKLSSMLPFTLIIISIILSKAGGYFPAGKEMQISASNTMYDLMKKGDSWTNVLIYAGLAYSVLIIGSLLWILFNAGDNRKISMVYILIFLSAITSKVVMGFSPTVYASGTRTTLFCTLILYELTVIIMKRLSCLSAVR